MLLERDSGRKIAPDPALPPLDVRQKRRLIQDFAARLSREGSLGVERAAANQVFDYWLQSMSLPRPASGRGVTRLFIERARLLHEPLPGQVEFVHILLNSKLLSAKVWI